MPSLAVRLSIRWREDMVRRAKEVAARHQQGEQGHGSFLSADVPLHWTFAPLHFCTSLHHYHDANLGMERRSEDKQQSTPPKSWGLGRLSASTVNPSRVLHDAGQSPWNETKDLLSFGKSRLKSEQH